MRKIIFFIVGTLVANDVVLSSTNAADIILDDDDSPTKNEQHEMKRRAMLQALTDHDLPSSLLFASPQEQRSQYYIHEGLKSAFQRSLRMTNFDSDALWEYLDDTIVNGEDYEDAEDGNDDFEMAYPQFLEEVLTGMIREVEDSLQKLTTKDDHDDAPSTTITTGRKEDGNNNHPQTNNIEPETAFIMAFNRAHDDLHCDDYKNVTIDDPKGKWNNMTKAYWKFFNMDPPPKLANPPHSANDDDDDDDDNHYYYSNDAFYTTEGNVYFDFLHNANIRVPYLPPTQTTQRRGMFAARDFERDELVYSFMANGLFFLELSTFETFIRNSTLLSEQDACLFAKWSFAQKLTRPGRYYICTSVDEGAFFNQDDMTTTGSGSRRVNVYMEDDRDLKYYAARKIAKGEEIISRK